MTRRQRRSALVFPSLLLAAALLLPGRSGSSALAPVTLIPPGATWNYLDDGSDQGTSWRQSDFDDAAWVSGPAQLGYGDGDEATVVGYGPSSSSKYITTYFRHAFTVADVTQLSSLTLTLLHDDGAVVYLNGTEILRRNMPTGSVTYVTRASSTVDDKTDVATVSPGLLVNGRNVLAVEVHQADPASSDISFDLSLAQEGLDSVSPTVMIAQPTDGAIVSGTITVSGTAADDQELSQVQVRVDSGPYAAASGLASWTYDLDTSTLSAGPHTLTARATDANGNTQTDSVGISVDNPYFDATTLVSGLSQPTAMQFAPDGRLFVCEQAGRVRVVKNGVLLSEPFVTLAVVPTNERGVLGIAFDPQFAANGYVYVYYTASATGKNRISRFTASASNPDVAAPGSELVILENVAAANGYHNGGALHFGPDGKLYAAVGDAHGSSNAQSLSTLAGKILRLDPASYPNVVPPDNPFVSTTGARGEIWAYGLRNPFTFAVNPATGMLYVNDVGEQTWEEINPGARGANYGWSTCEGACGKPGFTDPVYQYGHNDGCAITAGTFYEAAQFPAEYRGSYFFADYCGDWIKRLGPDGSVSAFLSPVVSPVDLKVGTDGSLFYLSYAGGAVGKVTYVSLGNRSPAAVAAADPTAGAVPLEVAFDASGSSDPDGDPLTFTWDFGDGSSVGTGSPVTHTYSSEGTFTAVLTVSDGQATATDSVQIAVGNAPVGTIVAPTAGARYRAGDTIAYEGTATDAEDGALAPSAFTWEVVFHHEQHTHPALGPVTGSDRGTFKVPQTGEKSADVWYRIHLTVKDSAGLVHHSFRDVTPVTSTLTFDSDPTSLEITLDGQPRTTPFSIVGVVGAVRDLGAPSPQTLNGKEYTFASWSDAGAQNRAIVVPDSPATYTALYQAVTQGNLVTNPGFESGETGWYFPYRTGVDASVAHGGMSSAKVARSYSGTTSVDSSARIAVQASTSYRAETWVKTSNVVRASGGEGARILFQWFDSSGSSIRTDVFGAGVGTTTWTNAARAVTSPSGAATARFRLQLHKSSGTAWFDDLVLRPG